VVLNDPGDADSGPNNQQNFPVISSAANTSSNTIVQGALNSAANTTFLIELFSNNTADPGGFGEGQTFLGRAAVTTAADGTIAFTTAFTPSIPLGRLITGTATDPAGNTSQFSAATPVVTQILLSGVTTPEPGQFRLSFNTAAGTNYTIQFSTTLTNWATLFVTNAPTGSFSVVDPNATNAYRFYRVLLGP